MNRGAIIRGLEREAPARPMGRRAAERQARGQVCLSVIVQDVVHDWIRTTAAREHRSVSAQIAIMLEREMAARDP